MGLLENYYERIRDGGLKNDNAQAEVVEHLARLARDLDAAPPRQSGILKHIRGNRHPAPRGLYIHGAVGRGKTLLMDMFFDAVETWPKRRVHFHAFMQDVHARRANFAGKDVIGHIAEALAAEALLLCLDEMQIVDIADAMIIGRLYNALHKAGVVLVTTSNQPPELLYKDGLNRQLFLPFIARIGATMDVVSLEGIRDYRLGRVRARQTFIHPLGKDAASELDALWRDLTDDAAGEPMEIAILGRKLTVPRAARGCARFSFAELCERPLGPPDFLAIAKTFQTVFVEAIPKLKTHQRNEARRFIVMIDTFYDARIRLVASAAVPPEDIFPKAHANQHMAENARTVSRLREMQSSLWWGMAPIET